MAALEFGEKLSTLRKRAGLTQEELAEKVGVVPHLVSRWENGHQKPGRQSLLRLFDLFADQLSPPEAGEWARQVGQEFKLEDLQQRVHHRETALLPQPVPAQQPPLPASYVQRRELQAALSSHLPPKSTGKVLVLWGPGGSGKSTLAAWGARKLKRYFPDGIVWVAYTGVASAQQWIAQSFQVQLLPGASLTERAGELRTLLRQKRCLLVLDDLQDDPNLIELKVYNQACPMLITTRDRTVAYIFEAPEVLPVEGMTRPQGQILLKSWSGGRFTETELDPLLTLVENLPLALSLMGVQLQSGYSPAELLAALTKEPADLAILDIDPPLTRQKSLARCFDVSYTGLDQAAQQYFAQLGCFRETFTVTAAAAIWGLAKLNRARRILDRLVRLMLVTPDDRGYRLHPLLRRYARQRLASDWPDLLWLTQESHTVYFIRRFLYHPQVWSGGVEEAVSLDRAWADIVAGVQWAVAHRPELAAQAALLAHTERPALLAAVGRPLIEAIEVYLPAAADRVERALLHEILGDLGLLQGDNELGLAHFEQAGQEWAALENGLASSQAHLRLAGARLLDQDWPGGAAAARQARTILAQSLPMALDDMAGAARLFYWFTMVYTPLIRWPNLPEEDVAKLAELAAQTGQPLLHARGLNIYQLWCTTREVARSAEARQHGITLAVQAFWLWRQANRADRADDEISFARYRLSHRYSRRAGARFAYRRSRTTPRADPAQRQLFKESHPAIYWWLGAAEAQRIGWLSWMLPRYLGVDDLPEHPSGKKAGRLSPLRPDSRAFGWVEMILNVGMLGETGRRLAMLNRQPPAGHILNGPEWRVLSGQRVFPLVGDETAAVVRRYLAELDLKLASNLRA